MRRFVPILSLLLLAAPALADEPVRDHDITVDDYFTVDYAESPAFSPDGAQVVYVAQRWDLELDRRNADLWVVDVASGQARRLTFSSAGESAPAWSPDGRWIYFASARSRAGQDKAPWNGSRQVFRVAPTGGEAQPVTSAPRGVGGWQLSDDGASLWFTTTRDRRDEDEFAALRGTHGALEYGHGTGNLSLLTRLDLATWRSEQVLDEGRVIGSFAVSPDGARVAMVTTPDEEMIWGEGHSRIDVLDRSTGALSTLPDALWREGAPSPYGWLERLAWSGDSAALSFGVDFDGFPAEAFVAQFGGGEPTLWRLDRPGEFSIGWGTAWRPGTRDLCLQAQERGRIRVRCLRDVRDGSQGADYSLTDGDVVVWDFAFSGSGDAMAVVRQDPDSLYELQVGTLGKLAGRWRLLVDLNPQAATWRLPQVRIFTWTAPDGTPVEGILELPADWTEADGPLPTLVHLHGGPTWATPYRATVHPGGQGLFAARGWALFSPNYRGSTGYGDAFLTGLVGHANEVEVADILSGVDALVEAGVADGQRLGVAGWSNGGYLTNCVIAQTDRFAAAASGAGVFDQTLQWAVEDTPGHVVNYVQGLPWEVPDALREASPLATAGSITTPTLIHVGENDPRVPPAHSRALYRALSFYLDVPAELIIYPGAGHGLHLASHRRAKIEWDFAWFDRWVLGIEPGAEEPAEQVDPP